MSYRIRPVERQNCVLVTFEQDASAREIGTVRREVEQQLRTRGWRHVLVNVTAVDTVLSTMELFEVSKGLPGNLPRDARVALVVRKNQASHAKLLEKCARGNGLFLTFFVDAQRAEAWIRRDQQERSSVLHRLGKQAAKAPREIRHDQYGIYDT